MTRRFNKTIILLTFIFGTIGITGCWDNQDITERAFISAVGLDKGENGDIELTLQILRPNVVKAKQEAGTDESAMWVFTSTGKTVFEAARNQLETVNRKPFYSHMRLIIIGEELAREGISESLDFFMRDHEMKIIPKMLVAKGTTAKRILSAQSMIENVPTLHIEGILENNMAQAKTRDIKLIDSFKELMSQYPSLVIGSIIIKENVSELNIKNLKIEGASVFKKDKLIGYLDPLETRGYLFAKDEVESGVINIENPLSEENKVAIEIKDAKGSMDVIIEKGEDLKGIIEVEVEGTIGEQHGAGDLSSEELIKKLQKDLAKEVKSNINMALEAAQKKYKLDFFGFSEIIYKKHNDYWKVKKEDWSEEFSNLPIEIRVKTKIDRTGMITKSTSIE